MKKTSFSDKHIIIEILYAAFIIETFPNSINFVVKQDKKRAKRLYRLMEYQCKMALRFGEIFLSDDQEGCVLFLDSEKKKTTLWTIFLDIKLAIQCTGLRNAVNVIKREKILKRRHPKTPFLHLWIMGINPESQGKGIGTKLLNEVLQYYGDTKPIYLETTTENNRNFYKKLGFEVFDETFTLNYPLYFLLKPKKG
jgi:GNAT superfamily N-acetyltransferase